MAEISSNPPVVVSIGALTYQAQKKRTEVRFWVGSVLLTSSFPSSFCNQLSSYRLPWQGPSWRIFRSFQLFPCQTWHRHGNQQKNPQKPWRRLQ